MRNLQLSLWLVLWSSVVAFGQTDREQMRKGNQLYKAGDYPSSLEAYKKAVEINPNNRQALFNQGDAAYKNEKYADAAAHFEEVANASNDPDMKAKAYHNQGNALLQAKEFEKSIEAFKKSLRISPGDAHTRYNLSYAKKKLKEKQQNQQEQDQKDQNQQEQDQKDQNQQEQNQKDQNQQEQDQKGQNQQGQDQDQKDQNQQEQDQKDQNQQEQDQKDQNQQEQDQKDQNQQGQDQKDQNQQEKGQQAQNQQEQEPRTLSRQNAERLLNALKELENAEQQNRKKRRHKHGTVTKDKDW